MTIVDNNENFSMASGDLQQVALDFALLPGWYIHHPDNPPCHQFLARHCPLHPPQRTSGTCSDEFSLEDTG